MARVSLGVRARVSLGVRSDEDDILPFIAFTNLIKCSSSDSRGTPSYRMRVFCPPKIWGELDILNPDLIVAFGSEVHEMLTTTAGHQGRRVGIPKEPWNEFVSKLEVGGTPTPMICMYHPTGGAQSINTCWSGMRQGKKPTSRLYELLKKEFGDDKYSHWATRIAKETNLPMNSKGEEILLHFLDDLLLSPSRQIPQSAWED
jgi:hypothetical protein